LNFAIGNCAAVLAAVWLLFSGPWIQQHSAVVIALLELVVLPLVLPTLARHRRVGERAAGALVGIVGAALTVYALIFATSVSKVFH
jgi:hypothetical protein